MRRPAAINKLGGLIGMLAVAAAIGGCAITAPVTCAEADFVPPPELTCGEAVDAARPLFATLTDVVGIRFQYDQPCPPNARCMPPAGNAGYVIATLADGREAVVNVSVADGILTVDGPHTFQVIDP